MCTEATWVNGKRRMTGWWLYNRSTDRFYIRLNSRDRITGEDRRITTANDSPEWGNWKLVRGSADPG